MKFWERFLSAIIQAGAKEPKWVAGQFGDHIRIILPQAKTYTVTLIKVCI